MSVRLLSLLLALVCLLPLASARAANPCVLAEGGMGGTGAPAAIPSDGDVAASEGIGGTGATAKRDSGGMGGTGDLANEGGIGGTGIVGVVTGFGSICVGGIEIHYSTSTPISSDGVVLNATQLKIGHVVQVHARGIGESVRAQSIELVHAVAGPVNVVDAKLGRMEVLGQPVRAAATLLDQAQAAARAGHPVQVSGLRAPNGDIVATRVDAAPGLKQFGVIGPVRDITGSSARIGKLAIKLDAAQSRQVRAGQSVEICGSMDNGALRARTIETKGAAALQGRVERLVIEGFVGRARAGSIEVGDAVVGVNRSTRIVDGGELASDQRVVVAARVQDGKLVAERIERVRERDHGPRGGSSRGGGTPSDEGSGSDQDADKDSGKGSDGKDGNADADGDRTDGGGQGSGKDGSKSGGGQDSGSGSHGSSQDVSGADAAKDLDKAARDRSKREADAARNSARDAARPPKDPKPDRPSGSSSHGARPDRIRDK